ncbi:hypothetical protein [Alteromonas sp. S015]|uniref:hypothetical protein n=1 Tax=Alteromonas sp. S015 TaxID=3117401 RepID=UPI002FE139EF
MNVAARDSQISDFQANTFTGKGINLQNAGDISVEGGEFDATLLEKENTELYAVVLRNVFDEEYVARSDFDVSV